MDRVTVFGPNLSGKAQRKGDMHLHAATCDDCKRYGPGKPMGGDDKGWSLDAESRRDVVIAIYGDHGATVETWGEFDDLYVAPCVTLPDVPPTEAAVAPAAEAIASAEQIVAEQIAEASKAAKVRLAESKKMQAKYDREVAAADKRLQKIRAKHPDTITEDETKASDALQVAHSRFLGAFDAVAKDEKLLRTLADPEHVARRVADLTTPRRKSSTNGRSTMSATTTTKPRVKRDIPQDVVNRIVKAIESGKGVTAVAKELADDKVTAPSNSGWYGRAVYNLYVKATGKSVGEARKQSPLASRKLKDRAPAATKRVSKTKTASKSATKKASAAPARKAASKTTAKSATKKTAAKAAPAKKATTARKATAVRKTTTASKANAKPASGSAGPKALSQMLTLTVKPDPKPSKK